MSVTEEFISPNLPDPPGEWATYGGAWFGPWPLYNPAWPMPKLGEACVYYLYDHNGVCQYVGRTKRLSIRLGEHTKDGKVFAFWVAQVFAFDADMVTAEAVAINMALTRGQAQWNRAIPEWLRTWAGAR